MMAGHAAASVRGSCSPSSARPHQTTCLKPAASSVVARYNIRPTL